MAEGLSSFAFVPSEVTGSFSFGKKKTIRYRDISAGLTFLSWEYVFLISSSELSHVIPFQHVWHFKHCAAS